MKASLPIPFTITLIPLSPFPFPLSFSSPFSSSQFIIAISCPDINPVLLFLEVVKVISNKTEDPDQLLPTVLTALFINTMGLAVICLVLGYTKQTRLLQFVPATVMIGFLGEWVGVL